MTWYEITIAVAGALGGFEFIKWAWDKVFNRRNNSRIEDTKAAIAEVEAKNAEIEVEKNKALAAVEAKEVAEDAHAKQCHQYEERIADLHKSLDTVNEQLDYYIKRDMEKEKRFDEQTKKLRDVQHKLLEETQVDIEYEKRIAELELTLEKVKCHRSKCPFRLPPNAETPAPDGRDINEYFKDEN